MAKLVKFTDEIRRKLLGISVVSNTIEFKLTQDGLPEEFTPMFKIKNLTVDEIDEIKEYINKHRDKDGELDDTTNLYMEEVVRKHIHGWDHLYDMSIEEEIPFKGDEAGACDPELYKLIPRGLRAKVLGFLYRLSGTLY